jgi:hypothetical protein
MEEELSRETVKRKVHELEQVGDSTPLELCPKPSWYSPAETRHLIELNAKNIEVLTRWKHLVKRVLEPDYLIARFDSLIDKRLAEAQSVIKSLSAIN